VQPRRPLLPGAQLYKGNGKHRWEVVVGLDDGRGDTVRRLRVPGGWIYETTVTYVSDDGTIR
jgi:hypothetical protein